MIELPAIREARGMTARRQAAFVVVSAHEGITDLESFAALWSSLELDALADAGCIEAIVRKLNGGLVGADDGLRAKWEAMRRRLEG